MPYGGMSTTGFPRLASYAQARKHFDKVRPWDSKYNPGYDERPIGTRAVKSDDSYRFNKAMRELSDGSIAFRLYNTDCVIWHPNNRLTIQGYASMSTTGFISALVPDGIDHGLGMKDENEPILHLRGPRPKFSPRLPWEEEWPIWRAYWNSGQIIQCGRPVLLQRRNGVWQPAHPDKLEPFLVPTIDRTTTREIAKRYHLAEFERLAKLDMGLSLVGKVDSDISDWQRREYIIELLHQGRIAAALRYVPRGQIRHKFTRRMVGTEFGAQPGFLRWLRDEIYDENGAITREEMRSLTPNQYARYKRDKKRFDA